MGRDEQLAFKVLDQNRQIQRPLIEKYHGEWLKEMGDGVLAAFSSTTDALKSAEEIILAANSAGIKLRIGIHLGEVVFQGGDVFGDGVNIAARVEAIAAPGSVLMTEKVFDDIRNKPDINAVSLGLFTLKNVSKPIEVFALDAEGLKIPDKSQLHRAVASSKSKQNPAFNLVKLLIGVLLLLAVSYAGWKYMNEEELASEEPTAEESIESSSKLSNVITLATLPFSNISGQSDIDYLGFALADQVISSLSYLQNIVVRSASSIRKYSNKVVDPQEVGDVLGVQFILMGHYIRNRDSIRLNLELIDIASKKVTWRGQVQEQMADIFKLQDVVATIVINGLELQFSQDERKRMVQDAPENPLAYEYYLKSLDYPFSVEGNRLALGMLEKSVDLDSNFAPTYSEIANRTQQIARYAVVENQSQMIQEAIAAHESALKLNNGHLNSLSRLALIKTEMNQKDEAVELVERVLRINPNHASAHFTLGYIYRYAGALDEAILEMEKALNLDPNNPMFRSIAITYGLAGRYSDAVASLDRFNDGSGFSESVNATTYLRLGDTVKAREALELSWQIDSVSIFGIRAGALMASLDGSPEAWVENMRDLMDRIEDPETLYLWIIVSVMLDDKDFGLKMLGKAVDLGYFPYSAFRMDPLLDVMRDEPEFKRIMLEAKKKHEAFMKKHFLKK
jgi:TolB-like protein/Tfp pilus assembly protein PilF